MKYIFDFDDVLFNNTRQFKEHMFRVIANACGIEIYLVREDYKGVRENFSLEIFIRSFLKGQNNIDERAAEVYRDIMVRCPKFVNEELRGIISYLGRENCYLVTSGEPEFQEKKIKESGCLDLFTQIFYVSSSKKDAVETICELNEKADKIYFIDDREDHFQGLDKTRFPNLETIHFGSEEFRKFKEKIDQEKGLALELKKGKRKPR